MNNDLISRSALLETFCNQCGISGRCRIPCVDYDQVAQAPAVDAVEVVRCKDCVHWVEERTDLSIRTGICKMTSEIVSCVFYCAYGAKMDAEVE